MRALRKRESELVQHWRPKFESVYEGMGVDVQRVMKSPTSLEELFDPLIRIMNSMDEPSESHTNLVKEAKP